VASHEHAHLQSIADTLDGLRIAMCVFDDADRTLLWNAQFLRFFPEHRGQVHVGEPYRDNLRRFYRARLAPEELGTIERLIDEGVARHRSQVQPYTFAHRGVRLRVASLPLDSLGRLRLWQALDGPDDAAALAPDATQQRGPLGSAFDVIADGLAILDAQRRIVQTNHAFATLYRLPEGERTERTMAEVYREAWESASTAPTLDERARYEQGAAILADNLRFTDVPFELPLPQQRCIRVIGRRLHGGLECWMHVDVSAEKRQQARMRQVSALLEATLERMDQGVMMVSAQGIVEVCNRRAMQLLDLPAELMRGQPTFEAVLRYQWSVNEFAHSSPSFHDFVRAGGIADERQNYVRKRPDGTVLEIRSVPLDGGGVLRTYTDVTERARAEERVQQMARHDALTTLVNRAVLLESLDAAIAQGQPFAVHFVDLDGFKPINDRLGHAAGDAVLTLTAARMRASARDVDVVARLGGDEFAILQHGAADVAAADRLGRRVLESLRQPMEIGVERLGIDASIGIALFPAHGVDASALLQRADAAMYAAKAGRTGVQVAE